MKNSTFSVFREFLDDNKCLEKFDKNFVVYNHGYSLNEDLFRMMGYDDLIINRCFDWETTEEGFEYWQNIDKKWKIRYAKAKDSFQWE